MTLDQATRILKTKSGSMHNNAAAAAYVHSYYTTERPDLLRPVGDAHRRRTRDQGSLLPGNETAMGVPLGETRPIVTVGPKRILRLDGPASSYGILSSSDGEVWLVQHSGIGGITDPGRTATDPAEVRTGDRAALSRHIRSITASRDASQRKILAGMNEAARKLWARG